MQEYLIDKEALRKLINESPADTNRIAITINLAQPQEGIGIRALKFEPGKTSPQSPSKNGFTTQATPLAIPDQELRGCPNPPGC